MKILVLILFSIFSFGSAYGNCGKLVNALLTYDSKNSKASFEKFYFTDEEFCDGGKNEMNANLEVQLIDKSEKILSAKNIFISSFSVVESLGKNKDSGKIEQNRIHQEPQYRTVKFSLAAKASKVVRYRIFSLGDKKLLGSGEVR